MGVYGLMVRASFYLSVLLFFHQDDLPDNATVIEKEEEVEDVVKDDEGASITPSDKRIRREKGIDFTFLLVLM